ncbi:sensor histidine kinase [Sulfitobacter brevis]|uniref:sensor histidine kinase n=1 Tax=Sulfitobacter brevis TaxID=74348 RepID=UPI003CCBF011
MRELRGRAAVVLAFLGVVLVLAGAVWRYGYVQGLDQLAARGQADLALAGDRLVGQLQRYRDLAVVLADHPDVRAELEGSATNTEAVLLEVADKSAALDIAVLDRQGRVRAAAKGSLARELGQERFVQRALRGALGWGHGPGLPLTPRAFYQAAPVFDDAGKVMGAVLVVTDLNGIDYNWRGTNPAAFFTDAQGIVYISNRSELLFWQRPESGEGLSPPAAETPEFSITWPGGHEIWHLGWGPYLPQEALHMTRMLPVIGMRGEVLLDVAQARRLAWSQSAAVAALCLAFGSLLFLAAERRRALAEANMKLEGRVAARTVALRDTNAQLLREARDREKAQAALQQAQADLVQAGKLSALGQMSAGISHELNQPLMAIRSFAENAVQFMERDKPERAAENLARISDMARRMGRIIQNLRAFARQDSTTRERVDLGAALHSALELTQTHVREAGVEMEYAPADGPLWVRGGEVRLSQVFVNLITNAVDAMAASDIKVLRVDVDQSEVITVNFRDTGPGIEMPDKVFDPFYTTKSVGPTGGMGLGLSISYGIVQSFGGQIRGSNLKSGGAWFRVTLERAATQTEAA